MFMLPSKMLFLTMSPAKEIFAKVLFTLPWKLLGNRHLDKSSNFETMIQFENALLFATDCPAIIGLNCRRLSFGREQIDPPRLRKSDSGKMARLNSYIVLGYSAVRLGGP
jgi:hypothetical protein